MAGKKKNDGRNRIGIVGSIVSGKSYNGWFVRCTGSESVLSQIGDSGDIDIYINSHGGSVFAGFEIVNALNAAVTQGRAVTFYVSPLAASIASYITSGVKGARVIMSDNAKLMFHAPWSCVCGSKDQFKDAADLLGKMEEDIISAVEARGAKAELEWFSAGRMKWFSAKEAVKNKLADEIGNPPSDLIAYVTDKNNNGSSSGSLFFDSSSKGLGYTPDKDELERFAAQTELKGYIASLCAEHFDDIQAVDVERDNIRVTHKDGSFSLLNYENDPLNIVNVNWESARKETQKENDMSKQAEQNAAEETSKELSAEQNAAEETSKELSAEQNAAEETSKELSAAPKDGQETPKVPTAEPKDVVKPVLPSGMTEDMILFAAENYAETKNKHIAAIKAVKTNSFTDEELDSFPMKTLAKMAKLAVEPQKETVAPKTDSSLIAPPASVAKGNGSLPPPID
ncbi:MAG: ATP-dependent Clp protease proteolytic subunit [Candidatus Cloacimonetes bacterium]|nr:ATP-dependent Clp protease proteolytic subunit [Candidatus Cloacimonadota bacterium]